ncbi:uncharacterized protein LOC135340399 [Halichondria panicea]|uniref:uncharacterized protein LOC135340399 n=1 Tax=Halichondria panicea TaxID=6063 RepID=UPI00312B5B15
MADMDRSLALYLWLFLVSLCTSVCAVDIPKPVEKQWFVLNQPATVRCGLSSTPDHYWWLGTDINNPLSFRRHGIGNNGCMDGSVCTLPYSNFNLDPNTYLCCTENGASSIVNAVSVHCQEIAVCPQTQMSVPLVVETDRTATAYIKITAKPPPNVLPENLLVISIEGGQNINFTSSIVTPRLLKTNKALETVYKYQFEVSRDLLASSTTTLKFVPRIDVSLDLPSDSSCDTGLIQPLSVNGVSLQFSTDPPTAAPETTTPAALLSTTEGLKEEDTCIHFSIPFGTSIFAFLLGLVIGLITCWTYWCTRNKRVMVDMSKHTDNFCPENSVNRKLPNLPISTGPPFQLHFSPNSLTHPPLTTQLSTATPTPDESARLLAGQTPNYPPMEKHPLNHDPIPPYATMDQIRSSGGYSPPETNHLTIDCRGGGYPSPVGNSPPPQQMFQDTISSVSLPSDGYMSHYTKEGDEVIMTWDDRKVETVNV